jgi:hypothetical protein
LIRSPLVIRIFPRDAGEVTTTSPSSDEEMSNGFPVLAVLGLVVMTSAAH